MKSIEFLKSYIENKSEYVLTSEEEKTVRFQGIEAFIFNKLSSSKFRSEKTSLDYEDQVKKKIELCVAHQKPIYILMPFGGYKNPNIENSPHINYAEVFSVAFLRDYLKPIAAAYKPGVILDYWSVAVFQRKVNLAPIADTDIYHREFQDLISFYQSFLPHNLSVTYTRVEDDISRESIEKQLDIKVSEIRKNWKAQSRQDIDVKLAKAKRNICIGNADINDIDLLTNSAMYHDVFVTDCWAFEHAKWDIKSTITLGNYGTSGWAIRVKSCQTSTVHFWSGIGLLNIIGNKVSPTILSASQFNRLNGEVKRSKVNIFGTNLEILDSNLLSF